MAILTTLFSAAVGGAIKDIFGNIIGEVGGVWKAYLQKEISEAERDAKIAEIQQRGETAMHDATMKAAASMWSEFQQTVRASPMVQRAYVVIMVTQTFVLLWHQWLGEAFQKTVGVTVTVTPEAAQLSVALLVICMGGSPFVFKKGTSVADFFKR